MIKFVFFAASFFRLFGVDWDSIDTRINDEFPAVETVSAAELVSSYDSDSRYLPLIIDVREQEEFAVSHLSQARNLKSAAEIAALVSDKSMPIVVYCSVGYRSAGVAAELESLGYSNVKNLQRSIFGWAMDGLPLENERGATELVHPFNRIWGSLIDSGLHSYLPQ